MQKRGQQPYNVAYYADHREQELERVRSRQREALEFLRGLRACPAPTAVARSLRVRWISTTKVMLPRTSGFFSVPARFRANGC